MTARTQTAENAAQIRDAELDVSVRKRDRAKGEETIRLRRSLRSITLEMLVVIVPLSVIYTLVSLASKSSPAAELEPITYAALVLLNLVRIGVVLEFIRRYLNDLYIIDNRRIRQAHGYLSLNFKVSHVKHHDIREVTIEQSVIGRMFDFGDVKIGTASTNEYEIELKGIRSPKRVSRLIMDKRRQYKKLHLKP